MTEELGLHTESLSRKHFLKWQRGKRCWQGNIKTNLKEIFLELFQQRVLRRSVSLDV